MTIIPIAAGGATPTSAGASAVQGLGEAKPIDAPRGQQAKAAAPKSPGTSEAVVIEESKNAAAVSPALRGSPTLPAGVSFIEEPSGIKIYFNNEQIQSSEAGAKR
jgi:hypothetical protein